MSVAKREFPIHMAVREGHAEVVQLPGRARLRPHPKQGGVWSVVVTSVLSESGYRRCRQRRPR